MNYTGSLWATWDASAPPFLEYLGDFTCYLDLSLDAWDGREGETEEAKSSEHNLRNLCRRWAAFMEAASWEDLAIWRHPVHTASRNGEGRRV